MGVLIGVVVVIVVIVLLAKVGTSGGSSGSGTPRNSSDWQNLDSAQTPDELYQRLRKRSGWDCVQEVLLKQIFINAQGDISKLMQFIMISDAFDLVNHNYLKLQSDAPSPDMTLGLFATTLERLGAQQAEVLIKSASEQEKKQAYMYAQFAYLSAILCDDRMLPSYSALAYLYLIAGETDAAREWCDKGLRLVQSIKTGQKAGSMWDMTADATEGMLQELRRSM